MACQVWVGGGLLVASVGCSALSLGAVQGQALIGRPLDVSIPLALADGETVADACATSQVFFADDAVSSSSVRTAVAGGASGKAASVRVQTTVPLPEAFVRIELQVGCTQRLSRSYVVLADLAPVPPPMAVSLPKPVVASNLPMATPTSTETPRNQVPVPEPAVAVAPAQTAGAAPTPRVARKTDAPAPRAPRATSQPRKSEATEAPAAGGARLKLDPLELMAAVNQMQPALRMSVDAPVESAENADLEQRRQAARLLWKALNESPEQLAANALKAEAGDAESARIKAALAAAQQAEQAAQAQLLQEQEGRYTDPLFLGLLAALAVALGGVATLWRRQQRGGEAPSKPVASWLKAKAPVVEPVAEIDPAPKESWLDKIKARFARKPRGPILSSGAQVSAEPALDIDVETLMPEDDWPERPQAAVQHREVRPSQAHSDFGHSALFEAARSVATEELFDLQQQVEFFISLGQADQAIEVLKAHLADSDGASPLAYLDLLKLHHELGRREDYEALRNVFNAKFNGNAPTFDRYSTSRRGLERYEAALSRIQALWPQPAVLHLIERSIFRSHPDDQSEVFDLEAYRELLLLYGIAREVIESLGAESVGAAPAAVSQRSASGGDSDFGHTAMQPLPVTMSPAVTAVAATALVAAAKAATSNPAEVSHIGNPATAEASGDEAFGGVGLDLDLSLDSDVAEVDAPLEVPKSPPADDGFGIEPNVTLPSTTAAPTDMRAPTSFAPSVLDLDFSDLGEPEAFTIKKSGKPS